MNERVPGATALVTGSSGFLGAHLVRFLLGKGMTVRGLDLHADPTAPAALVQIQGDASDPACVAQAVAGVDVVFHLVAQVPLRRPSASFTAANETSPGIVAEQAAHAGVPQMVLVSSSAVWGLPATSPLSESAPPRPFEPYGRAKLAGERAAGEAARGTGLRLAIVRPRTIVAADRLGIFSTLFTFVQEDRPLWVPGGGLEPLQLLHVDDLLEAMWILAGGVTGTFAAGARDYGTLAEDLAALAAHAGSRSCVKSLPPGLTHALLAAGWRTGASPLSPWHYRGWGHRFAIECSGLEALGWTARWSNAELLAAAYDGWLAGYEAEHASVHRRRLDERSLTLVRRLSKRA